MVRYASQYVFEQANANVNESVFGSIIYNVKAYGADGNWSNDDTGSITKTITAAAETGGIVCFPPGTYITSSQTFPSNVVLWIEPGAMLSVTSGSTITINGGIEAGLYQIFTGSGTVSGSPKIEYALPQWFGAVPGSTDSGPAFNKALDLFDVVFVPPVHSPGYRINTEIELGLNKHIYSTETSDCWLVMGANRLFNITGSYVSIENFFIDGINTSSETHAVFYVDTTSYLEKLRIKKCEVWNAHAVIRDANSSATMTDAFIDDLRIFRPQNTPVKTYDFHAFIHFHKLDIDLTRNITVPTFEGLHMEWTQGVYLERCDVLGYGPGPGNTSAHGFVFVNGAAIWISQTMTDTLGGNGFMFTDCIYVNLNGVTSSLCGGHQFRFEDCDYVKVTDLYAGGRDGQAWEPASSMGILVLDCDAPIMTNLILHSNSGDGLWVENSNRGLFSTIKTENNQGSGIHEVGTSDENTFLGVQSYGNGGSSGVLVGSNSNLVSWRPNSGTFTANTPGPATV